MNLNRFIALQQQSMYTTTEYYNKFLTIETCTTEVLLDLQKQIDILDHKKCQIIFSMNLKELNTLRDEISNIIFMVNSNISQDILRLWITRELNIYSRSIYDIRIKKAIVILQTKWKTVFKIKTNAACNIQKIWRKSIANPEMKVCRNRLIWEFENII